MRIANLPADIGDCSCGMRHTCVIKCVEYGRGAVEAIPEILKEYKNIILISDDNTYRACGERVYALLSGFEVTNLVLHRGGVLIPNEEAIAEVNEHFTDKIEIIVGVGSGVINDLCKYVSFNAKLPYMIVATAPSMDGYASVGAAMITDGMKVTYNAHTPTYIVGDTDVLKDAPMDMIRSGVGDILGKISCLNDWKLSHIINGEHFCEMIYNMVAEEIENSKRDIDAVQERDADSIERLFHSLIMVGIGMSYMGNSRPASGSEHHLAHFYEIVNIIKDKPYFPHGTDVAYGTLASCTISHLLASRDPATFARVHNEDAWNSEIERVYTEIADSIKALQAKVGFYATDRLPTIVAKWGEIKATLLSVPSGDEITDMLTRLGLPIDEYKKMYGRDMIRDSVEFAKDLKDRYTLLWLANDAGLLREYANIYTAKLFG